MRIVQSLRDLFTRIRNFFDPFRDVHFEEPRLPVPRLKKPAIRKVGKKPIDGYSFNPVTEWPRNARCPCGSGRKFKSCCAESVPRVVPDHEAKLLRPLVVKAQSRFKETGVSPTIKEGGW